MKKYCIETLNKIMSNNKEIKKCTNFEIKNLHTFFL